MPRLALVLTVLAAVVAGCGGEAREDEAAAPREAPPSTASPSGSPTPSSEAVPGPIAGPVRAGVEPLLCRARRRGGGARPDGGLPEARPGRGCPVRAPQRQPRARRPSACSRRGSARTAGRRGTGSSFPIRPNGAEGWIRSSAVRRYVVDYRIVVDLSDRLITVYRDGGVVVRTRTAIGRPETPTPTGSFYVNQRLLAADPIRRRWARVGSGSPPSRRRSPTGRRAARSRSTARTGPSRSARSRRTGACGSRTTCSSGSSTPSPTGPPSGSAPDTARRRTAHHRRPRRSSARSTPRTPFRSSSPSPRSGVPYRPIARSGCCCSTPGFPTSTCPPSRASCRTTPRRRAASDAGGDPGASSLPARGGGAAPARRASPRRRGAGALPRRRPPRARRSHRAPRRRSRRAGAGRGRRRRHRPLQRAAGRPRVARAGHPGVRPVLQRRRHGDLAPRLARAGRRCPCAALPVDSRDVRRRLPPPGGTQRHRLGRLARARPALERPREPRRSHLLAGGCPRARGHRPLRGTHEAVARRRRRSLRRAVPSRAGRGRAAAPRSRPTASVSATGR